MNPGRIHSFLPVTLACVLLILCGGCTHFIEWRGSMIPTLVWSKSNPDVEKLREQRKTDSTNASDPSPATPIPGKSHWPAFRGPSGDGIYPEPPILTDWPREGPPLLWRKLVGGGHSSLAIANGLAFTIEQSSCKALANLQGEGSLKTIPSPRPRLRGAEERGDAFGGPKSGCV